MREASAITYFQERHTSSPTYPPLKNNPDASGCEASKKISTGTCFEYNLDIIAQGNGEVISRECNLAISECNYFQNYTKKHLIIYLLIIYFIKCSLIFQDHEKWRYDHLARSLIQATLTTFIIV